MKKNIIMLVFVVIVLLGCARTDGIDFNAGLTIESTFDASGMASLVIFADMNDFGGVEVVEITGIATSLRESEDFSLLFLLGDEANATGGEISLIEFACIGNTSARCDGLTFNIGVFPIIHISGEFTSTTSSLIFVNSTEVFSNASLNFSSNTIDTPTFVNINDRILLGENSTFNGIEVLLNTSASKSIEPIFEFSNGETWTEFLPLDTTFGFQNNGLIAFKGSDLVGWSNQTEGGLNEFWIRIERTRKNLGTVPIESIINTVESTNIFFWGDEGDVMIKNLTFSDLPERTDTGNFICIDNEGNLFQKVLRCDS